MIKFDYRFKEHKDGSVTIWNGELFCCIIEADNGGIERARRLFKNDE